MSASSAPAAASASSSALSVNQQADHSPQQSPSHKRQRDDDDRGEDDEEPRRPPAQRAATASRVQLHRHALESLFAYLTFSGLASAFRVSRDWQAAVGSMRSIAAKKIVFSATMQHLAASRLRRHVTDIFLADDPSPAFLALLHERMPHLLRLSCRNLTIPSGVQSNQWPPRLLELKLRDTMEAAEANMLLRSIGQLSQLQKLWISLRYDLSLSFAPLAQLPLLRLLRIDWSVLPPHLSNAQVDEFRALADVEEFNVQMDSASMLRLLRLPHTLRWLRAPFISEADDAVCALLPSLSCVTALFIRVTHCSHFDFLPRIQSLTELDVGLSEDHPSADAATQSLVLELQHCPRITSLTLHARYTPITSNQLAACLSSMPALSTLEIHEPTLPSLAFLSLPSLAQSLRVLRLYCLHDPKPAVSELQHLHGLQSLRELMLTSTLSALDDATRAAFTPPSALLPLLEKFQCCWVNTFPSNTPRR